MGPQDSVSPDIPVSPVGEEGLQLGLSAMTMHLNPRGEWSIHVELFKWSVLVLVYTVWQRVALFVSIQLYNVWIFMGSKSKSMWHLC